MDKIPSQEEAKQYYKDVCRLESDIMRHQKVYSHYKNLVHYMMSGQRLPIVSLLKK